MSNHVTILVQAYNAPSVLPRVLLVFSRRRQRIQALQCYDLDGDGPAEIQADLQCEERMAAELVHQLERIVEVVDVRTQRMSSVANGPTPVKLVAAG